jgi:hypothetical protein
MTMWIKLSFALFTCFVIFVSVTSRIRRNAQNYVKILPSQIPFITFTFAVFLYPLEIPVVVFPPNPLGYLVLSPAYPHLRYRK